MRRWPTVWCFNYSVIFRFVLDLQSTPMFLYSARVLSLATVVASTMTCGGPDVCGVLTVESGQGSGNYHHDGPCVHGIWPEVGSYGTSKCVAPSVSTKVPTKIFPCYAGNSSDLQLTFEQHEWSKHGVCAGVKDATDFFTQVRGTLPHHALSAPHPTPTIADTTTTTAFSTIAPSSPHRSAASPPSPFRSWAARRPSRQCPPP